MPDQPDNPDVDRCRAVLDVVQADVLTVVRRHVPLLGAYLVTCAMIELVGGMAALVVEQIPDRSADIDAKLAQLRLHVLPTPTGPAQ